MKTKALIFTTIASSTFLFFSTSAFALPRGGGYGGGGGAMKGGGPPMERLQRALDLSDNQVEEIKDIFFENRGACRDEKTRQAFETCREENREKVQGEIRSVLSSEQAERFSRFQERREQMRGQGGYGPGRRGDYGSRSGGGYGPRF